MSLDSLAQDDVILGYDTKATLYDYNLLDHKFNKNQKQLCFFDHFNDSISVLLNGKTVVTKWFKPDPRTKLNIVMLKAKSNRPYYVRVIMHQAKKFIEFPLDSRFRFVEIYFSRDAINDNDFWTVNFTNNVPHKD